MSATNNENIKENRNYKKWKYGGKKYQNSQKNKSQDTDKQNIQCFKCKEYGHYANECTKFENSNS